MSDFEGYIEYYRKMYKVIEDYENSLIKCFVIYIVVEYFL